ncbi:MAG: hypothetical protein H0T51_02465 [Pirellulales bacterium]|nr:hypothetical protein [Pirellulales bacterium]
MIKWNFSFAIAGLFAASIAGCSSENAPSPAVQTTPDATYVISSEPQGAVAVGNARKEVKDQDEVVLVGRIGGSETPFVDGIAAFTIVDSAVPHCSPEEGCPTPWDYCCEQNAVKENIAMVKIVDAQGKAVSKDARALLGVKELNLVVVRGKAQRDADGNLSLLADQIYVKE